MQIQKRSGSHLGLLLIALLDNAESKGIPSPIQRMGELRPGVALSGLHSQAIMRKKNRIHALPHLYKSPLPHLKCPPPHSLVSYQQKRRGR